ncbi:MAG: hypothetical protein AAB354_05480, partial [candidate division KSB1 bacterium]
FGLSLVCYLGTALFLHLSYQRYYWFLLALAGAALQILNKAMEREQNLAAAQPETPAVAAAENPESPINEV